MAIQPVLVHFNAKAWEDEIEPILTSQRFKKSEFVRTAVACYIWHRQQEQCLYYKANTFADEAEEETKDRLYKLHQEGRIFIKYTKEHLHNFDSEWAGRHKFRADRF